MDVTYNFTAGTRAVAQQVNQNFADVKSAIDPLQTDVADIKTQLTGGFVLPDGSVDFTRLQSYKTYTVSNATNATPIVITAVGHGFLTGDKVYINGVGGNTAANGVFTITKIGADTFSLDGSVGNGAFSSNGTAVIYPNADKNLVSKVYVDNETSKKTVGEVISVICTSSYVPEGCLPCDGAEYSFSQFPTFVSNYLTSTPTKLLTCTYSEYATSIETYGQCAKFAVVTTNQKFKTPTIKDGSFIQQAMSDTELGKAYKAGLPNITGSLGNWGNSYMGTTESGAFKLNLNVGGSYGWNTGGGRSNSASFDASRSSSVYGNSTTVQPNAVALRYFVVVANGTLNSSQMDWSNYMSALAGKADITKVANLAMPSSSYIDLTLGASDSTYTAPADGFYFIDKNAGVNNAYINLYNTSAYFTSEGFTTIASNYIREWIPVKKGDILRVEYNASGATSSFRFIYAEGSKP